MPPPPGYLDVAGIDACVSHLVSSFPALVQPVSLPETTREGRPVRAFRLRAGAGPRNGLLMVGGTHARETINPDTLVRLALHLCWAYTGASGLTYGGKSWSATDIRLILDGVDLFVIPQLNPDGRAWVFNPAGDRWWRMNRSDNAGTDCMGTDLNRNFDFLWKWTIGNTSADPCDAQGRYRGDAAFSEPETRNVRWLLDAFPNINAFVDVHSYSELLLYPWGDDDDQTTDPSQNFQNSLYDGQRGYLGTGYGEYIPRADLDRFVDIGTRVRAAIEAVRGRRYTLQEGTDLYGTSGTSSDYAYSRYFRRFRGKTKVFAWGFETNTRLNGMAYGFQPPIGDALDVMDEVSSGLIQLALSTVCLVRQVGIDVIGPLGIDGLRLFRDTRMRGTPHGDRWISLLETHSQEVVQMVMADRKLRELAEEAIAAASEVVLSSDRDQPTALDGRAADPMRRLIRAIAANGSPALVRDAKRLEADLERSIGKTAVRALGRAPRARVEPVAVRPEVDVAESDE